MVEPRLLTIAELAVARVKLIEKQGGGCAICSVPLTPKTAKVDHDHKTGYIRGALCNNCNGIEGKISNLANRAKRKGTIVMFLVSLCRYLHLHRVPQTRYKYPSHKTTNEKRLLINKRSRMKRKGLKANGQPIRKRRKK